MPYKYSDDPFYIPTSPVTKVVWILVLLSLIAVGVEGIALMVSSAGLQATNSAVVRIDKLSVTLAHDDEGIIMVGKILVPTSTPHPESYKLEFRIEGERMSEYTQDTMFRSAKAGDSLRVSYAHERLFNHEPVVVAFHPLHAK